MRDVVVEDTNLECGNGTRMPLWKERSFQFIQGATESKLFLKLELRNEYVIIWTKGVVNTGRQKRFHYGGKGFIYKGKGCPDYQLWNLLDREISFPQGEPLFPFLSRIISIGGRKCFWQFWPFGTVLGRLCMTSFPALNVDHYKEKWSKHLLWWLGEMKKGAPLVDSPEIERYDVDGLRMKEVKQGIWLASMWINKGTSPLQTRSTDYRDLLRKARE